MRKILVFNSYDVASAAEVKIFNLLKLELEDITKCWDIIIKSPDDTYYISSPTNDSRFNTDWKDEINGANDWQEVEFPEEWSEENV